MAVGALLVALSSCGGGSEPAATATPIASPTPRVTTIPTETATETPRPTATPPPKATTSPEEQPGGAGDEQAARVPVTLTLREGRVEPPTVSVPGFLALALTVHNRTGAAVDVRVRSRRPVTLTVPAGATRRRRLAGLRPGSYPITAGAGRRATLEVGAEPGP